MKLLKSIENKLFKKTDSGETLFYPYGIVKSYHLKSEAEINKIRDFAMKYLLITLTAILMAFGIYGTRAGLIVTLLYLALYQVTISFSIRSKADRVSA